MKSGRRGFLEAAGLTIAGLWTLGGGLAKLNGVRAFFQSVASLRGSGSVAVTPAPAVASASVRLGAVTVSGRATVSFKGVAVTPGTGELRLGA